LTVVNFRRLKRDGHVFDNRFTDLEYSKDVAYNRVREYAKNYARRHPDKVRLTAEDEAEIQMLIR